MNTFLFALQFVNIIGIIGMSAVAARPGPGRGWAIVAVAGFTFSLALHITYRFVTCTA